MGFSNILKRKYNSWKELEKVIENLNNTHDKGEVFEQFIYIYFLLNKSLYQIKEIYRPNSIPKIFRDKYKLEKRDSGVDGLIIRNDGKAAAYQVKFRAGRKKPKYDELAKFWVEGRYTDINYTIANTYGITGLAKKNEKSMEILVDVFDSLDSAFFSELHSYTNNISYNRVSKEPRDYQQAMIDNVVNGFQANDRGKLIAACGTGKTLAALWIAEKLEAKVVLFLAPSLALIRQTLLSWSANYKNDFQYICVCSDKTISDGNLDEQNAIKLSEFCVPVTTKSCEVVDFLSTEKKKNHYIFSTYQSLSVIADAMNGLMSFAFDLTVFDESHRIAGTKETTMFNQALSNHIVPSNKRLFMTATERLIRPSIKKKANNENRMVFSMDDKAIFGPLFHRYNFGDAISDKVISDYQIVVAGIQEGKFYKWLSENAELEVNDPQLGYARAEVLFSQLILAKSIKEFPINKVISFHSSVENAKVFSGSYGSVLDLKNIIKKYNKQILGRDLFSSHVNGKMSSAARAEVFNDFIDADFAVVSNAKCLTEGVDVPSIDCVYFVDRKSSLIDIVQACGRALRKEDSKDKTAFFLLPILIPDNSTSEEILNLEAFETVFNVIQSLRDQDNRLSEWIDCLNKDVVKGKFKKYKKYKGNPIVVTFPNEISLDEFEEKLYLKIAHVNKNPSTLKYNSPKNYAKLERKSGQVRIFKTLGDYSFNTYFNKLVIPSMNKFKGKKRVSSIDLKVNHNNVSHTRRLGLITRDSKDFILTPLGNEYINETIEDKELFKRQMLRYFTEDNKNQNPRFLFPYRACIKILLEVKSISFYDFAFGIYHLYDGSEESILGAIQDIRFLREEYPKLSSVNDHNKSRILKELNDYYSTSYSENDIWAKKTTINNQFIYFRDHLSLFDEFIEIDADKKIVLKHNSESKARHMLSYDNRLEFENDPKVIMNKYIQPFLNVLLFSL